MKSLPSNLCFELKPLLHSTGYLLLFTFFVLLASQPAYADFRKAVDAYIARDGDLLMQEVKDAVDKQNDDGLMLFLMALNIDANTSTKSNLYEKFKVKGDVATTLDSIFNTQKKQSLFNLLKAISDKNSADTQLLYSIVSRLHNIQKPEAVADDIAMFAKKGSYVAQNLASDFARKAEVGDPFSQLRLGLSFLNFYDHGRLGCNPSHQESTCQTKDEVKGYHWLKQALKTYEKSGHGDYGQYADAMCEVFQNIANGDTYSTRQAYLWCVLGVNSGGSYSWGMLNKMYENGSLKSVDPELTKLWEVLIKQDRVILHKTLNLSEIKETPVWIIETRQAQSKEILPIFSYYVDDYMEYEIDVYADGIVKIAFGDVNNGFPGHEPGKIGFIDIKKDVFMQVPVKAVKSFIEDLKSTGFFDWQLNNDNPSFCDNFDSTHCLPKRYQITYRDGIKTRRVFLRSLVWHIAEIGNGSGKETVASKSIAIINALVEKHFPTQFMRCGLTNSQQYKQACLQRDFRWANFIKESKNGNFID